MIGKEIAYYKILDRLGGGGMGVVYKAEDTRLGRIVALKLLHPELLSNQTVRKRFVHEARAASVIDHPNVCHVFEVGEAEGNIYMAMSYCEGRSLLDVIRSGPVPPREALSIAFGVAQGLAAAHRRGIVHRDIKPANVMLTDEGFVRIVDFGLALLIGETRVTTDGVVVGTVAYMSPEQTSNSEVSANTDIWSLGVTLYELLTGQRPFRGEVNAAIVYSIVNEPHTPLLELNSSVPPQCVRIVDRCLEKDPTKRYQTIEELLEDMATVAQELGWESTVARATIEPILRERRRRILKRRFAIGAASLAVVAGGAYGGYRWTHRAPPLFTTRLRVAVMPFDNLIGAKNEAMVDGLADYTAKIARWVSRGRQSMWTVLYSSVADAQLPDAKAATGAFGVNRVIVGDVQRVGASPRVRLKLQDAKTGRVLEQASIRCDVDSNAAVLDSLPRLLEKWFEVKPKALPRGSPWQTNAASAARPYLEGLCFSRRGAHDPDARDRALASLRASANMDSTFAMAQCAAGFAEMANYNQDGNRSRLARAINDARRSRRLVPSFTDANILLGNVFRALERPDSAEACYLQASREDPASASACERLGDLYAAQARLQESEQSYLAAMHANPDYWITHRTLGVFYFSQHRIDDAAAAWNDALKLAPNDIVTLNNLGVVHYYRGEWSQAQNIFLRSFQIRPDCNSCNNVATSLFLDGQFKESASYFELALSPQYCDSTDHVVLGNLASALYWVDGSRPRAVTLYRRAIHLATSELDSNPNSPDLIARLVDYYAMVGDSLQARAMIARAEPFLQKDSDVMYRVGSACEKLGDRALAMKHLANAVRHGYQWPLIRSDPSLRDLVKDGRFLKMINIDAAAEGASAATHTH